MMIAKILRKKDDVTMINLLKFGSKNHEKINLGSTIQAENFKIVATENKEIAMKQIKLYEDTKNYIESIIDEDGIVRNIPTINKKRLENYTIQFDTTGKYIHVKDRVSGYVYGVYSLGNKKLVAGDKVQFVIFNILQRITCPCATEGCKKFCYANKSNCSVKCKDSNSVIARIGNIVLTMFENFDEITTEVIKFIKDFTNRKIVFRFHEAGDIYSREYWEKIKKVMLENSDVNFMYYTKTVFVLEEINELNSRNNIAIRYSLDSTTKNGIVEKCYALNCLTFIVVDKDVTIEAIGQVGNNNMCNTMTFDVEKSLEKIKSLNVKLEAETRKTYANKIQAEINKLNASIIDKNKKCTNCLKCMNSNKIALFVATH